MTFKDNDNIYHCSECEILVNWTPLKLLLDYKQLAPFLRHLIVTVVMKISRGTSSYIRMPSSFVYTFKI